MLVVAATLRFVSYNILYYTVVVVTVAVAEFAEKFAPWWLGCSCCCYWYLYNFCRKLCLETGHKWESLVAKVEKGK